MSEDPGIDTARRQLAELARIERHERGEPEPEPEPGQELAAYWLAKLAILESRLEALEDAARKAPTAPAPVEPFFSVEP